MQKLLKFFSAKILALYAIFNDQKFNDTLTNDIDSFEKTGSGALALCKASVTFYLEQ